LSPNGSLGRGYYEIYSGGEQDPKVVKKEEVQRIKKIVKKTTPQEPYVMKRQGSDLSVIEEKCR